MSTIADQLTPKQVMELSPEERLRYIRQKVTEKEFQQAYIDDQTAEANRRYGRENAEPNRHTQHLYLSEDEIQLIYDLLDEREKKAKAIIDRCSTISKQDNHRKVIWMIEHIREQLTNQ